MLGLALALLRAACDSTPDAAKPDGPHPALWEITDSAGAVEGWLFGTIHALPDGAKWQSPRLTETLGDADMLVVEVADLDNGEDLSKLFEQMAFDRREGPLRLLRPLAHAAQRPLGHLARGRGSVRGRSRGRGRGRVGVQGAG